MAKVTYLFGAGASAEVLPVVDQIPNGLGRLSRDLGVLLQDIDCRDPGETNLFKEDIDWLLAAVKRHSSIDTYAKKLSIARKTNDLNRLKGLLSLYFLYAQAGKPPDKRYDSFFASILKQSAQDLPSSIRIVSWNYDHQFELSYNEFSTIASCVNSRTQLGCISRLANPLVRKDRFAILKLNGNASLYDKVKRLGQWAWDEIDSYAGNPADLTELVTLYRGTMKSSKPPRTGISFAWENDGEDDFMQDCISRICETEILVVIGYSFPFFNREIDTKIIGSMTNLRKVYFQDIIPDKIRQKFISLDLSGTNYNHSNYELISNVYQFFLPPELEL